MDVVYMILLLLALICFVVASRPPTRTNVNLVPLGLALWVAVPLIQAIRALN